MLNCSCAVLMGANIAMEIANENFSETTIGCLNAADGAMFQQLFETPYFRVSVVQNVSGVEICGALKNIVAIAAGIVDGLKWVLGKAQYWSSTPTYSYVFSY